MKEALDIIWLVLKVIYYAFESIFYSLWPPRMKDVSGRTVLITGGGGGLGKQLAIQFAKHGARIVLWDIDEDSMERTASIVRSMKSDALSYCCDCSNEAEVNRVAQRVFNEIGPIDILVNNAGILHGKPLLMLTGKEVRKTFDINVLAHFWTLKAFLPLMMDKNEGHIVTISSSAGLHGTANLTDYSASKFALMGLHQAVELELKDQGINGIKFTIVCPNFINTGMSWYPKTNVPWLLPILDAEDVAISIVHAVQSNTELLILPKALASLVSSQGFVSRKGADAVYKWTGLGIEPHTPFSKHYKSSTRK
eukprot:gene11952-13189_t